MFRLVLVMVSLVVQMVGVGRGPVPWWFVRVSWLLVDGAAFGGVLESWLGVLSALLWFLVPAFRGRRWFTGLCRW